MPDETTTEAQILCTVSAPDSDMLAAPTFNVNGRETRIAFNTEMTLPASTVEAIRNSSFGGALTEIETLSPPTDPLPAGDGDGAANVPGGGEGGADTFNAVAIIDGTLAQIEPRLVGLTVEQLDLVAEAEAARGDKARSGVADLVAKAKEALAGGQ